LVAKKEEGHDPDLADHRKLSWLWRAVAEAALRAGDNVVATARHASQLGGLQDIGADRVRLVTLDVTDAAASRAAAATVVDEFGRLDVVVNNAGYANSAPIEHTPGTDFRAQIETNLFGRALIPSVARHSNVSLGAAQWTLTSTLLTGALATPVLARMGAGPHRRRVILFTLITVVAGSIVTVLPVGFAGLLAGRGLQGIGVGLTSLVIGVARDDLGGERVGSVIGLLSVTSVAGIGLGYPLAGLLTQAGGLETAYLGGLLVSALALLAGLFVLPRDRERPAARTDFLGVTLLGVAVSGLLIAVTEASAHAGPVWIYAGVIVVCVVIGRLWVRHELRTESPLVDLRQLRLPMVLIADASVFLAGAGLYLLMTLASRYVQTPDDAGYGVHGGVISAGLVPVPFSLFSFIASRVNPFLRRHLTLAALVSVACVIVLLAVLLFAAFRGSIWNVLAVMGLTGLGVGTLFATVPALITASVPAAETTSAVGFNQVARTIGVTIGSALCGIILEAATPAGGSIPRDSSYTTAALTGASILLATAVAGVLAVLLARRACPDTGQVQGSAVNHVPSGTSA
jgi:NAD(P)-dependent dehydrogenase (short-subunit alcohol dehydrogenase family)